MTGAPKRRTLELLENSRRGRGASTRARSLNGAVDLSIAFRTIVTGSGGTTLGVGGLAATTGVDTGVVAHQRRGTVTQAFGDFGMPYPRSGSVAFAVRHDRGRLEHRSARLWQRERAPTPAA
ncbi:hypothetical protein GCM10010399_65940 [Dactylosporangium fulvum]|uniref:Uncharacterized protein n=1 Tax=Dactylosporangium fulvum TaxID=53359 RepID=A0ABY5VSF2_9ACTN|nr:hypothetical protein [Dactylosporangium fulvum]UWP80485.1 hypothetical protein Dfulv_35740 [Dactylosporangium fulvum]